MHLFVCHSYYSISYYHLYKFTYLFIRRDIFEFQNSVPQVRIKWDIWNLLIFHSSMHSHVTIVLNCKTSLSGHCQHLHSEKRSFLGHQYFHSIVIILIKRKAVCQQPQRWVIFLSKQHPKVPRQIYRIKKYPHEWAFL